MANVGPTDSGSYWRAVRKLMAEKHISMAEAKRQLRDRDWTHCETCADDVPIASFHVQDDPPTNEGGWEEPKVRPAGVEAQIRRGSAEVFRASQEGLSERQKQELTTDYAGERRRLEEVKKLETKVASLEAQVRQAKAELQRPPKPVKERPDPNDWRAGLTHPEDQAWLSSVEKPMEVAGWQRPGSTFMERHGNSGLAPVIKGMRPAPTDTAWLDTEVKQVPWHPAEWVGAINVSATLIAIVLSFVLPSVWTTLGLLGVASFSVYWGSTLSARVEGTKKPSWVRRVLGFFWDGMRVLWRLPTGVKVAGLVGPFVGLGLAALVTWLGWMALSFCGIIAACLAMCTWSIWNELER